MLTTCGPRGDRIVRKPVYKLLRFLFLRRCGTKKEVNLHGVRTFSLGSAVKLGPPSKPNRPTKELSALALPVLDVARARHSVQVKTCFPQKNKKNKRVTTCSCLEKKINHSSLDSRGLHRFLAQISFRVSNHVSLDQQIKVTGLVRPTNHHYL